MNRAPTRRNSPTQKAATVIINVELPVEDHRRLRDAAEADERPMRQYARRAIVAALDADERVGA